MKKIPHRRSLLSAIARHKKTIMLLFLLVILYGILYKLFIPRISAFGCFDDCFNIVGGFFVAKGKTLYSEIFFNHQMLMAYISAAIQISTKPENMYELILVHRQFLLIFGCIFSILLVMRFGTYAFAAIVFYELTKFYLFGNRFLAEAFIVYPLMYLFGLVWNKFSGQKLSRIDFILAAIFTWFTVFMREPYVPLAVGLFVLLIMDKSHKQIKIVSISLLLLLTVLLFMITPMKEYIFNVVTVNQQTVFQSESQEQNPIFWVAKILFYPIFVFSGGEWNHFRYILIGLSALFLSLLVYVGFIKKHYRLSVLLIVILGFANLRPVDPGHVYYSAFHMIIWYGIFLFASFLMVQKTRFYTKKTAMGFILALILLFGFAVFSPASYTYEKAYPHEEFITNYGKELQVGEGFRKLSLTTDTLFLDGFDDLIYWQANRISPYRYAWYTSIMPAIPLYSQARLTMFTTTPPDFYYGSCPKEMFASRLLPKEIKKDYIRLSQHNSPSCLFVHKNKLPEITDKQWKDAAEFGFAPPNQNQPTTN